VGREEISSLEDQMEEEPELEEAQRKSATRTSPRTATTASAARCFGGSTLAAGLAIGGSIELTGGGGGDGGGERSVSVT
jgi:pseudouridine-5'-phosphate glycosidase